MTRRERLERKAERRREWADSRRRRSAAGFQKARVIADGIPLGQPILVGHHSEKRHRRDIARIDAGMREGCESADMARTHDSKAAGIEAALDRAIFSDDRDALDALRARIAEREAERDRYVELNKKIRKEWKNRGADGTPPAGWLDRIGATPAEARAIASNMIHGWQKSPMFPAYTLSNLGGRIASDKKRLQHIEAQQQIAARAEAAPDGVLIETSAASNWTRVTFADKPDRAILDALKAAGYRWGSGSWHGYADKLPDVVRELAPPAEPEPEPEPPAPAPPAGGGQVDACPCPPDPDVVNVTCPEHGDKVSAARLEAIARDGCGCDACDASRAQVAADELEPEPCPDCADPYLRPCNLHRAAPAPVDEPPAAPPESDAEYWQRRADELTEGRTIWNSDGKAGPCLICPPPSRTPADRTLPDLESVRELENPDPAPVAELPAQTFELTPPEETQPTPGRLFS